MRVGILGSKRVKFEYVYLWKARLYFYLITSWPSLFFIWGHESIHFSTFMALVILVWSATLMPSADYYCRQYFKIFLVFYSVLFFNLNPDVFCLKQIVMIFCNAKYSYTNSRHYFCFIADDDIFIKIKENLSVPISYHFSISNHNFLSFQNLIQRCNQESYGFFFVDIFIILRDIIYNMKEWFTPL